MKISIERHEKSFNIALSTAEGRDAFLVLKGCRIMDGSKGRFVSVPSKKLDNGSYWRHAYISEPFQAEVLKAYDASSQKPQSRQKPIEDDDIPF